MNANELADYVDFLDSELSCGYQVSGRDLPKVATMLRQQAKRIEELENPIMQAIGTAFAKPLSDEEIINIYKTVPTNFINFNKETIAFARAIEERHGIK